jgi:hypothetical protein
MGIHSAYPVPPRKSGITSRSRGGYLGASQYPSEKTSFSAACKALHTLRLFAERLKPCPWFSELFSSL